MRIFLLFVLLLTSSLASAETYLSQDESCELYAGMTEQIAEGNQMGLPMYKFMKIAGDNEILRGIIEFAYSYPAYTSEEYQDRAISDTVNEVTKLCYEQEWVITD